MKRSSSTNPVTILNANVYSYIFQDTVFCHYPCQCPIEVINCKRENRSEVKDGCGCCFMCAKQLSEACSVKDICDSAKELYCDRKDDKSIGVCKGRLSTLVLRVDFFLFIIFVSFMFLQFEFHNLRTNTNYFST